MNGEKHIPLIFERVPVSSLTHPQITAEKPVIAREITHYSPYLRTTINQLFEVFQAIQDGQFISEIQIIPLEQLEQIEDIFESNDDELSEEEHTTTLKSDDDFFVSVDAYNNLIQESIPTNYDSLSEGERELLDAVEVLREQNPDDEISIEIGTDDELIKFFPEFSFSPEVQAFLAAIEADADKKIAYQHILTEFVKRCISYQRGQKTRSTLDRSVMHVSIQSPLKAKKLKSKPDMVVQYLFTESNSQGERKSTKSDAFGINAYQSHDTTNAIYEILEGELSIK